MAQILIKNSSAQFGVHLNFSHLTAILWTKARWGNLFDEKRRTRQLSKIFCKTYPYENLVKRKETFSETHKARITYVQFEKFVRIFTKHCFRHLYRFQTSVLPDNLLRSVKSVLWTLLENVWALSSPVTLKILKFLSGNWRPTENVTLMHKTLFCAKATVQFAFASTFEGSKGQCSQ